ncbi:MAG: hypothetical protein RIT37_1588 [Bacteroidota bacterium]
MEIVNRLFMTEYRVDKAELHALLKALGILQQDEQLMLVNNIELRDPKAEMLSIIVDTVKNGNMYRSDFEELTEKELSTVLSQLYAFEQFLLKEFMQIHNHITRGQEELQKRKSGDNVNKDGIPIAVDKQLGDMLKSILDRNQSDDAS